MGALDGRVALVTGGARGIGRATALALAREGAAVAVNFNKSAAAAGEVAAEVIEIGSRVLAVKGDVAEPGAVLEMFGEVERDLGPVDILVANAGVTRDGLAVRMSVENWDEVVNTNLRGAFLCAKSALRHMMKSRWGRIVFVSSVAAIMGNPGQANYAASKAGLIGLAKSLDREIAGRGITVNVVAPGFIETDMTASLDESLRERLLEQIPVGRFGEADEVASAVTYLCSPESAYICGAVVPVDGGIAM